MGKTEANRVIILDTTLRDGEKSLGMALRLEDKLEIAKQLARLGVDVIEAGYPALRGNNFEATRRIAEEVRGPVITAIAAAKTDEVDRAWEAIKEAEKPRLHLYLSVSDILQQRLFRLTREEGLRQTAEMVARAKTYCEDVEFSAHDFSRADLEYSCRVIETAIEAGATTISLPDTAGQAVPAEFERMILTIRTSVRKADQVMLSVHCHNNLGMAVANSLAALRAGARQVEGSISGIGQPAGNAALEQVVMALEARRDYYGLETGINTDELLKTIEMVAKFTEVAV